jgi:hypothetical protein
MFPKNADPAKVKAHHDHIHAHFDLTLAGLNLERWVVIFVIFGLFQASVPRPRSLVAPSPLN